MPIIRYPCSNIFVALIHLCSRYIFEDDKRERILKIHKLILSYVLGLLGSALMADNHELIGGLNPSEPFALNVSHCNLKPGKTMNQVDKLVGDYIDWSKKNNVETTIIRGTPFYTHRNDGSDPPYDFTTFEVADYETMGKNWDAVMSTKSGQKLFDTYSDIVQCDDKFATVYPQWTDVERLNVDRSRITLWNWCTAKPGVSVEQLQDRHASAVNPQQDSIGWFVVVPRIGGANAPGKFAHVMVYPDVSSVMSYQKRLTDGGWERMRDYYASYANCSGHSATIEEVFHMPGL